MKDLEGTKVVVIPFKQGVRLTSMKKFIAEPRSIVNSGFLGVASQCDYTERYDPFVFDYNLDGGLAVEGDDESKLVDYSEYDFFNKTIPTRFSFKGSQISFDRCDDIARDYCYGGSSSYFEGLFVGHEFYVDKVAEKLSKCSLTDADTGEILQRLDDSRRQNWCEIMEKLKNERLRRSERIIDEPKRGDEETTLMRPAISMSDSSSSLDVQFVDYPSVKLIRSYGPKLLRYITYYSTQCAPEGKMVYSQFVSETAKPYSDLIIRNDASSGEYVVFLPAPQRLKAPKNSVIFMYYPKSSIEAANNSTVVATNIRATHGSFLYASDRLSTGLSFNIANDTSKDAELIINTDEMGRDDLNIANLSFGLMNLYMKLLLKPNLHANWIDAAIVDEIDGGLVFVGPMTRYVKVGNDWTVVCYGNFANVVIDGKENLRVYKTSPFSNVRVNYVGNNATILEEY